MITIKHVLKDGTHVDSVDGKVINAEEHRSLYELISRMQKEGDDTDAAISAPD